MRSSLDLYAVKVLSPLLFELVNLLDVVQEGLSAVRGFVAVTYPSELGLMAKNPAGVTSRAQLDQKKQRCVERF